MNSQELENKLAQVMLVDRHRLQRRYQQLKRGGIGRQDKQGANVNSRNNDENWQRWQEQLERSIQQRNGRIEHLPSPSYDDSLPVSARRDEIKIAIENHQVVILAGETGSGKTTQLPKICLDAGRGRGGLIGHTQPRRIAARSVAQRIASELASDLGDIVGYKVRFNEQVKPTSYIKLMTDGILLAEIQHDRFLENYDTIIIDEAHERSLNIDFILGYFKKLLPKRPDLKLIVTSATIDHHRFAEHFDHAPVIEVSGRTYPVETLYRPLMDADDGEASLQQAVANAVEEAIDLDRQHRQKMPGDILIFCSGEKDIREFSAYLRRWGPQNAEILPLYARLSQREQQKIFTTGKGRRIIIATNVAETSLTVPGIRYVIDLGTARVSRYSYRSKVQRLPIEGISQASANQRKGRCGRVSDGVCIRLYSEEDFLARKTYTDPEILRTNLASVILQMESLKLGSMDEFPFIEKPDNRFVKDGYRLLHELGATGRNQKLTKLGRELAIFPVDPRLARMVLAANKEGSLNEVLIIASALSIQDPRERPYEQRQKADQAQQKFQDKRSDFLSLLNIWQEYETQRQALSQNKLRQYCRDHFLNYLRMKEWRDIHHQLRLACKHASFAFNQQEADYASIHKAILTGLLGHLGSKDQDGEYLGARNTRFSIFPGSALTKKKPQWIMAAEVVETNKFYARHVAIIEPEWAVELAGELLKHRYSDPVWRKRRGEVMAKQKTSLYGLVLLADRYVSYSKIDPQACREIFISEGLVNGKLNTSGEFFRANQALVEEVEKLEHKSRRKDILVDEDAIFLFYHRLIPAHVCTQAAFEKWRRRAEKESPQILYMKREDLLQRNADEVTESQYPSRLEWQGVSFPLRYSFTPGQRDDGITVQVPQPLLGILPLKRLEWLVPGLLREKCIAMLKALPKKWRRNFVPIPDYVDYFLADAQPGDYSLSQKLAENLAKESGIHIPNEEWEAVELEPQYLFNIELIDTDGKVLTQSRSLLELKEKHLVASNSVKKSERLHRIEKTACLEWSFGDLPEYVETQVAGIEVRKYPAIVDHNDSVNIELRDQMSEAQLLSRKGLMRLLILRQAQIVREIKKRVLTNRALLMSFRGLGKDKDLAETIVEAAIVKTYVLENRNILLHDEYEQLYAQGRGELYEQSVIMESKAEQIFSLYQQIHQKLKGNIPLLWVDSLADIKEQLAHLVFKDFLLETPTQQIDEYPRYLQGILKRLEKLQGNLQRDRNATREISEYWQQYLKRDVKQKREGGNDPELATFRWMLEEFRISLFAQELKTKIPVSPKRLRAQWEKVSL